MEKVNADQAEDMKQKLIRAEAEESLMRDQLYDVENEFKFIAQSIRESGTEFEDVSAEYSQAVKDVEAEYGRSAEIKAELDEVNNQCKARQEQIQQTESIIESMEAEADNTRNVMDMLD